MRFLAGLVLSLAIIIPASTHAANGQVFGTRSDLYSNRLDNGRMVNFSICVGYIMGVWDAFIADDEIVGNNFCLPPKHPQIQDVARTVREYLQDHRAELRGEEPAPDGSEIVRRALKKRWPCRE